MAESVLSESETGKSMDLGRNPDFRLYDSAVRTDRFQRFALAQFRSTAARHSH